jgi:hypothetical protein
MARFQPALLGGLFIGVLSSLPVISAANICCCLWVVSGGTLSTYLLQQNEPNPIEASAAALQGLLAGVIGGILQTLAGIALMQLFGGAQQEFLDQLFSQMRDVPPEAVAMMERFTSGSGMALLGMFFTVPVYAVFGLLGGLLGVAFFRKKAPAGQM